MAIIEHDNYIDSNDYHPHKTCNVIIKTMDNMSPRHEHHGWHGGSSYVPVPYYTPVPAPPPAAVAPPAAIDPMQVIATMALVTFLLQSLMALLDRLLMTTRVVQAREERKTEKTQRIMKAIHKYQTNNWEDKQKRTQ
ncbi:hypothetical protein CBL_03386 [Carabus blaptoides fortunei]